GRHLLHPQAAVLQARVVADRREDDRQALRAGDVQQPLRRLDLRGQIRAERASRIGEPAAEVDDEDRGMRAERDVLAEPRLLVDPTSFFVAHARAASFPTGASSSPNFARFTNWPAPGSATSSSFSTITWPRTSTTSGAPVTSVPSNRL